MEKARPMMEKMDGKVVLFPPESAFDIDVLMNKVLFNICALTWRVNIYVSRQEKLEIGEMKVQDTQVLYFCRVLTITFQYC